MENLLLFVSLDISTILGVIIGSIIILPIIFLTVSYFIFAPRNIFFTFGKENRAMFIMLGNKFSGKVILPSNTMFAKDYNIYLFSNKEEKVKFMQKSFLGMYWIGMYPFYQLYYRKQQWQEWQLDKVTKEQVIVVRDEQTPYLITTPFEYAMSLRAAEDKGGIPLDIDFTIIVEPINLVRPIFDNEDAYGQLQRFCITEALLFVKQQTFTSIGSSENEDANINHEELADNFSSQICRLNESIPGRPDRMGLEESIGYRILSAKINTIDVVGDNKEVILKATTAKYVAEQEKLAQIEKAEGEAKSMNIITEAQDRRNKIYEGKPEATSIKISENIRDSKLTTLVTNGKVIPTLDI